MEEQMRNLSLQGGKSVSDDATENLCGRKGPIVPPKPKKNTNNFPQVPQSKIVAEAREPLYSRPLQSYTDTAPDRPRGVGSSMLLLRKQPIYETQNAAGIYGKSSKSTLDNPDVLEQQLEALAYHKQQMERKGLLGGPVQSKLTQIPISNSDSSIPKLTSTSLLGNQQQQPNTLYSNVRQILKNANEENEHLNVYSNVMYRHSNKAEISAGAAAISSAGMLSISTDNCIEREHDLAPPSPVSSSYSELRRATDVFAANSSKPTVTSIGITTTNEKMCDDSNMPAAVFTRKTTYTNDYNTYSPIQMQSLQMQNAASASDYYGYGAGGSISQNSSAYDSIYEPINPRPPPSETSSYLMYPPPPAYVNGSQMQQIHGSASESANLSTLGHNSTSGTNTPVYVSGGAMQQCIVNHNQKEEEVEALTDLLVHSMDANTDAENYGICYKCNERVLGENAGCTAMEQIYHIACFTCWQCQINLQGKPFYALEGKPYCEYDYLNTLEKCSVCMKPILERILRATGKPYHPQCFTCVICGNSLDGIPFTVDATNQNYCIKDFHKKFAPRCCVCIEPIMPDPGQEETIRVVALDRSFHLECYKCEDCGLLLSSEAEGRGCYPLDDHVLCKSCNAKRVQLLTNRMTTTEL